MEPEKTDDASTDLGTTEEASAPELSTTDAAERPETDSGENIQFVEASQVPKGLEEHAKQLNQQVRQRYLEKTRSLAEQRKAFESEREELMRYKQVVDDVRRDPKLWDNYKPILGVPDTSAAVPTEQPKIETWQDLDRYIESKVEHRLQATQQRAAQLQETERQWVSAWESTVEADPSAKRFRDLVANELRNANSQFVKGYRWGGERQIIDNILKHIRSIYQQEFDQQKQETIAKMKGKAQKGTEGAAKAVRTNASPLTKDEIIRSVREEFGPEPGL